MPTGDEQDNSLTNYRCYLIASHLQKLFEMSGATVHTRLVCEESQDHPLISKKETQAFSQLEEEPPLYHHHFRVSARCHLKESNPSSTLILCSSVIDKDQGTKLRLSRLEFLRRLKQELQAASYHKHEAIGEAAWEDYLSDLAEGCLRLQLMGVHHLSPVKVAVGEGTENARANAFILYNHARLCALFRRLETLVEGGLLPPLPPLADVDFSLLNQEEEWVLFWAFVRRYPQVLRDLTGALAARPRSFPSHALVRFLRDLAHCLSGYYGRVRVLPAGGVPRHLLPTLWARVYLLKAAQAAMRSACGLLGLVPPSVM